MILSMLTRRIEDRPMTLDTQLLNQAKSDGERLAAAEREALLARADYHIAVRRLHLGGGSLREVAQALGVSHQRVQQIVSVAGEVIASSCGVGTKKGTGNELRTRTPSNEPKKNPLFPRRGGAISSPPCSVSAISSASTRTSHRHRCRTCGR